jgi:hypothetical protein
MKISRPTIEHFLIYLAHRQKRSFDVLASTKLLQPVFITPSRRDDRDRSARLWFFRKQHSRRFYFESATKLLIDPDRVRAEAAPDRSQEISNFIPKSFN